MNLKQFSTHLIFTPPFWGIITHFKDEDTEAQHSEEEEQGCEFSYSDSFHFIS